MTVRMAEAPFSNGFRSFRRSIKRLIRNGQLPWADGLARRGWYYIRAVRDAAQVPVVIASFSQKMRSRPTNELVEFIFESFGGLFQPLQSRIEIGRLMERVARERPKTIMEIGTARGGTLFLLSCVADPKAHIVSVDLPAGPFGGGYPSYKGRLYKRMMGTEQSLQLIRGNSHEQETYGRAREALKGAPVDLLFIDGDHSYEGAKHDFMKYRDLVRPGGLIVFHDILENRWDPTINVAPLWREVSQNYETEAFVESEQSTQFGIGVVRAPAHWA